MYTTLRYPLPFASPQSLTPFSFVNLQSLLTWRTSFSCLWSKYKSTLVPGLLSIAHPLHPLLLHPPQGTHGSSYVFTQTTSTTSAISSDTNMLTLLETRPLRQYVQNKERPPTNWLPPALRIPTPRVAGIGQRRPQRGAFSLLPNTVCILGWDKIGTGTIRWGKVVLCKIFYIFSNFFIEYSCAEPAGKM